VQDLRLCHFVLGYDPEDWRTTMMRQFEQPDIVKNNKDREAAIENARVMKLELVKSHVVIGNDDAFM
jgi:hypothetical protein